MIRVVLTVAFAGVVVFAVAFPAVPTAPGTCPGAVPRPFGPPPTGPPGPPVEGSGAPVQKGALAAMSHRGLPSNLHSKNWVPYVPQALA